MDAFDSRACEGVYGMSHAELLDYSQTCLVLVLKLSLIPIAVATD